ncbi:hydroxymethylglutaryl-CoA lyase [Chitinophaga silvatica]|uniref:Hydroxymethylglutaryl-CoA lyase n=1 Tax=Chitinophaga silvatica TaxID=2282649 RepID=A0A3E1Y675_9BACT|nr:hydroxymethylglutaryl-CoA lyase [Chitinophaga silvatica]RFS20446.1 hydroxymethylglutaryl-CoA lyase [Chitinophaga silvatica]
MLKLIECPRDAMQGWHRIIPTEEKIAYLNALLKVGFDTIDFGSFVSPKAIPQMADTKDVVTKLDLSNSKSKLLAIVANLRGAEEAVTFEEITYLGFPFSVSETFQLRNTNKTIAESLEQVHAMQELCIKNRKELVIYISMGFGNPYGDAYSPEIVLRYVEEMAKMEIGIVSLADTVGVADPFTITNLFRHLIPAYPNIEIGAHFHAAPDNWQEKVLAAYNNGCKRFDSAMKGIGGCPMAKDDLVGNLATENMIAFSKAHNEPLSLDPGALLEAQAMADTVFRN